MRTDKILLKHEDRHYEIDLVLRAEARAASPALKQHLEHKAEAAYRDFMRFGVKIADRITSKEQR